MTAAPGDRGGRAAELREGRARLACARASSAASTLDLLHTGQHYDAALSDRFLVQLGLPEPDHLLGVGSGTHAEQTAGVMVGVERTSRSEPPDAILVAGDVNSTMAAAIAAVEARACRSSTSRRASGRATGRCPRRSTGL